MKKLKIIFFGSPSYSVPLLDRMINLGHDVQLVVSQGTNKTRRGKRVITAIHEYCIDNNIDCITPSTFDSETFEIIKSSHADLGMVYAYGKLIPEDIINLFKHGIINLHCSLLPLYRGAAPIQHALINDEKFTGFTFFKIDEKLDEGQILLKEKYEIKEIEREPSDLFVCDLNGDTQRDILILSSRDAPVVLMSDKQDGWKSIARDSVVRKSFLKGVGKEHLSKFSDSSSKKERLLVAGEGYVRVIGWEGDELLVIEQFNSKDQAGDLSTPIKIDWKGRGTYEIFAFHEDGYWERLHSENQESNLKNRWESSFIVPTQVSTFHTPEGISMVALGKSGFQMISPTKSQKLSLKVESRYLTDLPKIRHNGIEAGDFNNDGVQDLVCLDGKKNLLEFVTIDPQNQKWKSSLHFEVFEKNLHYQGKKGGLYEPREGLISDLNGDGLDDLAFLVHDRLLIYRQINRTVK